jgi:hypothetical protein
MKDIGWVLINKCTPGVTTFSDTDTVTVAQTQTSWTIKVRLANTGAFPATGVNTSMFGGPAWLGIPDGTGTYPDLAAGAAAFNTDTYNLDITNWPGGPFQVNLQVFWTDNCGGSHNQLMTVDLLPATLPTPVGHQPGYANRLDSNIPNPFNPSTTIHYGIGQRGNASLRIYDVSGGLVRTLVDRAHNPGDYQARWDGRDEQGKSVASGVYFYRLETKLFTQTKRMVLLK